jgi:hypothetical protein
MRIPDRYLIPVAWAAAVAILVWSLVNFDFQNLSDIRFIALAALSIVALPAAPPLGVLFTGLLFLMPISILYDTAACVLVTVYYAFLSVAFTGRVTPQVRKLFIIPLMVCSAFLYSLAFQLMEPIHYTLGCMLMAAVAYAFSFLARTPGRLKDNFRLAWRFGAIAAYLAMAVFLLQSYPTGLLFVTSAMAVFCMAYHEMHRKMRFKDSLEF